MQLKTKKRSILSPCSSALFIVAVMLSAILLSGCASPQVHPIRPGNEPFYYAGGKDSGKDVGILLIHGFTASPWEVKELGEFLAMRNITAYGILLPGHGTAPEDMKNVKWQDWYNATEQAYFKLKNTTKEVYVGGVSLGAELAFMIAENHDVQGVISISSPIYLRNTQSDYAGVLQYVQDYIPSPNMTAQEQLYYYDKRALSAVTELLASIQAYKADLGKVKAPVIIAQAEQDKTILPTSASVIYEKLGSSDKTIKWYNEASHVLTKSPAKDQLFSDIYDFIKRTE